jgi:hypothetical protein
MSDAGKGKYVPPHLRNKNSGTTATTTGTLMPMALQEATALRDWLNGLTTISGILLGRHGKDDTMQLGERITINSMTRNVRYNVHPGGVLGSTWIEGVYGVSINAQDNTRASTLLDLWRTATAPTTMATTTTTTTNTTSTITGGTGTSNP